MEPNTTVAIGAKLYWALAGSIVSMPLALLPGVQGDTFWIGMLVAICVTFLLDSINTPKKSASSILLASLSSGYASPSIANWIAVKVPTLVVTPEHSVLRMVSAVLIAASIPLLIALMPQLVPIVLRIINRKGDSL